MSLLEQTRSTRCVMCLFTVPTVTGQLAMKLRLAWRAWCRRIDEDRNVIVECIYEPPQSATADSLQLERGTEEEQRADYIAELLGCAVTSLPQPFVLLSQLTWMLPGSSNIL